MGSSYAGFVLSTRLVRLLKGDKFTRMLEKLVMKGDHSIGPKTGVLLGAAKRRFWIACGEGRV
jgi:hypothetical protein